MENELNGQTIAVFGSTGRVGPDVCRQLAQRGAQIVCHYFSNEAKAESLENEIVRSGGDAYILRANLTDEADVKRFFECVAEKSGKIDGVVNLVHGEKEFAPVNIADLSWDNWQVHLDAVKSHFLICREVIPYMRKQHYGRIVYISGGLSCRFFEGCAPFSSTKAAMHAFCKTLALEEGKNGISINIVAPGKVVRPGEGQTDVSGNWAEIEQKQLEGIPLKRFCTATDVAGAVAALLLPSTAYITGQTIYLAGGEIMPMP